MPITAASVMAEVGVDTSRAEAGLKQFGDKLNQTGRSGGQAMAPVRSALGGLEGAAKVATAGIVGLGTAMGIGALVGFGSRMVGAAVDMGRAAEASQRLAGSFEGLASAAGASGSAMLARLQQASGGAIAQYDLMLAANKAMMLGVVSNADDMGKLMEIARVRGTAMGLSVAQAFDNLVTGLGRGSALILDNLGIMVDADATNKEYAASVGKTVEQLTEQEKKQALVNRTLKEATGQALPVASAYERMGAAMADMKVELGELFGPAITAAAEVIASGIKSVNEAMNAPAPTITDGLMKQYDDLIARRDALQRQGDYDASQARAAEDAARQAADAQHDYALEALLAMNAVNEAQQAETTLHDVQMREVQALTDATRIYNEARASGMNDAQAQAAVVQAEIDRLAAQLGQGLYRAGERDAGAIEAAAQAQERMTASTAALIAQYEGVALVQQRFAIVKEAADSAGLSTQQLGVLSAQAATQFAVLTSNGYTAAQAMDIIAVNADRSAEAMAAATEAATVGKDAVEGLHGAQLTAATSANGLGIELHFVGDAGFGAKAGIDAASLSAVTAQGSFWGLVTAAQAASMAMQQAVWDSASNRLEAAYLGSVDWMGADKAHSGYEGATAELEQFKQSLIDSGVSVEKQKFLIEGYITAKQDELQATEKAMNSFLGVGRQADRAGSAAGSAAGKLGGLSDKAGDLSGKFQSILDKIPGLKGTSEVTDKQMQDAALGVPQNFADDYLRRLTDEVMNGVDWQGVDIGDAAQRAGIDPNLPAQMILELFKNAWADSSLFANPANLDLINMDAVKQGLMQANNAAQGKANIDALFGIGDDATVAAVAGLGLKVQDGLAQWLADNGAPDAGARLAEAIGAGLRDSSGEIGGGLSDATDSYLSSDAGHSAFSNAGKRAAEIFGASMVVRPIIGDPIFSATPNGGSATAGGSDLPPVTGPRPNSGLFGAQSTGATVIVNATVQEPHDIPMLARQVAREIQRRA